MKKKNKGVKIFLGFLLVLAGLAAALGARFYPVWKSAEFLGERLKPNRFTYDMSVKLDREKMPEEQAALLDLLAAAVGLDSEAMYDLDIRGGVDGDRIHALIYPDGFGQPLLECYLSDDIDVINGAMFYNAVREHLGEESALLGFLIPAWDDHAYVSLEQAEQLMEIDLESLRDFQLPFTEKELSSWEYFVMLAAMKCDRDEDSCTFQFQKEDKRAGESDDEKIPAASAQLYFEYEDEPSVTVNLKLERPADVLTWASEKLSAVGLEINGEKLRSLDGISVVITKGGEDKLAIPDDLISQNTVNVISGIRSVIREITGK